MRAGRLHLTLLSTLTALLLALGPAAAASDPGSLSGDPLASPGTGSEVSPPQDVNGLPGGSGDPGAPPGTGSGGLPGGPGEGLDLTEALAPDLGSGIYFAVGIAVGLLGLLLSGLLGTRFVTSDNVLENDARRAIFEYIKTNPGCHLRETAGALDLSTTNVLWHLRKLEESNLVHGKKLEGYKVFYPVEGGVEAKRMGLALAVLRNRNAVDVLGTIARTPGVHQREIARMLGVNHGTVRWHLKKLGMVQLVLEVRKGAVSQYYVSALGMQALDRVELRQPEVVRPPPTAEAAQALQATTGAATAEAESTVHAEA